MEPLNITITDLSLNTVIGQHYDGDREAQVPLTLADAIVEAAAWSLTGNTDWPDVTTRVRQIRDAEIRSRVVAEIETAVTKQVQRTDSYGQAVGAPTTLREEIARVANDAVKVHSRSSGLSHNPTPLQEIIRTEVDKALTAELKTVVEDEKAKVVAAVRAKAAELIASAVKEGLGR